MSDVRALLLTDVVDSTKLSEAIGDAAMAVVWTAHDRVARDLLPVWRGREIDKTDGMLLLFERADDAVSYAAAYHQALAGMSPPLQARAGLHVGPVILRENLPEDVARGAKPLEVDGLAKPTAARVMGLARGGQTLISAEALQALPEGFGQAHSHGHWQMKGVSEPMELFEVGQPPFTATTDGEKTYRVARVGERWLPVRQVPNNLPQQASSFLGRDREIDEIKAALKNARLVTLLGMGGLGKTRLSLQVAAELLGEYPDGAWFLDLSSLAEPALVVEEAARLLQVKDEPGRPLLQTMCAQLRERRLILVIDNCEHLIEASAALAHALLKAAPDVRMMASSRIALQVPGEQTYPVLPLPVPSPGDDAATLARSTAVRLFVARAQSHKPSFVLDEREAPHVAALVARLEGIPLALELAAARVRSLSVADINTRLKDRFKLLVGGSRVLQERQQTLRGLVDWSYDLLTEPERALLRRLAVFVGGFDLVAAEQICGAEPLTSDDVLDLLASLVEKSLVMLDERDEGARYRTLETIRDYAREKLDESGESADAAARHCRHYFVMAKDANNGSHGLDVADWMQRTEAELDNLRAATTLALSGGVEPVIAVKLTVAMQGFWIARGYATEGRNVVRATLAVPEIQASDIARAWALFVGGSLAESQSDHVEARQMFETCLELRRRLGNPLDIATALANLSLARLLAGEPVAAKEGELEALQIFREVGDRYCEACSLMHLGQIAVYTGADAEALSHLEQSLAIARAIKEQEIEGECERTMGQSALETGDLGKAVLWFKRSLTVFREAGDKRGEASALLWLGKADLEGGDKVLARTRFGEALRSFRAFEMWEELLECLEDHAALAQAEGVLDLAVSLVAVAAKSRERLSLAWSPRSEQRWLARLDALRHAMSGAAFEAAWDEGREWEIDEAIRAAASAQRETAEA